MNQRRRLKRRVNNDLATRHFTHCFMNGDVYEIIENALIGKFCPEFEEYLKEFKNGKVNN
jgi:hypothetical protein